MTARRAAGVLLAALALWSARAGADRGVGFALELDGGPGWRSALGGDARASAFSVAAGGGEVLVGLDLDGGFALLAGGRVAGGSASGVSYLEAAADLAAQARLAERVRARLGIDAGRAFLHGVASAPLCGGFLAVSFDLWTFGNGRVAVTFTVRLDLGAFLTGQNDPASDHFPAGSFSLNTGLGFRY